MKHIGSSFDVAAGEEFKITFPCADTFNVLLNTAFAGNGYEEFTYTFAEEKTINDGDEVCSFYTIVPADVENWSDITLDLHQLTQTISGIEWKVNSHVTLQGDLSEDNPKWGATKEYAEKQIDRFFEDEDGNPKGDNMGDGSYGFYLPLDRISELEAVIGAIFHEKVEIQLDGSTVFNKNLEEDYLFLINYNKYSQILSIYINYNISYKIYLSDSQFKDFSAVSNVLKQSTE